MIVFVITVLLIGLMKALLHHYAANYQKQFGQPTIDHKQQQQITLLTTLQQRSRGSHHSDHYVRTLSGHKLWTQRETKTGVLS